MHNSNTHNIIAAAIFVIVVITMVASSLAEEQQFNNQGTVIQTEIAMPLPNMMATEQVVQEDSKRRADDIRRQYETDIAAMSATSTAVAIERCRRLPPALQCP